MEVVECLPSGYSFLEVYHDTSTSAWPALTKRLFVFCFAKASGVVEDHVNSFLMPGSLKERDPRRFMSWHLSDSTRPSVDVLDYSTARRHHHAGVIFSGGTSRFGTVNDDVAEDIPPAVQSSMPIPGLRQAGQTLLHDTATSWASKRTGHLNNAVRHRPCIHKMGEVSRLASAGDKFILGLLIVLTLLTRGSVHQPPEKWVYSEVRLTPQRKVE